MDGKLDNIKGLVRKVTKTDGKMISVKKEQPEKGVNIKAMKKELEEKKSEKLKVYGFIGMEVYDLYKEEKIDAPQIEEYIKKMDSLNHEINKMEHQIKQEEARNAGKNICTCGCYLTPQDKFCPNCGEYVNKDMVLCSCGQELKRESKFCNSCGKSMEDILKLQQNKAGESKLCICGATVPAGQFMCFECGRKIED